MLLSRVNNASFSPVRTSWRSCCSCSRLTPAVLLRLTSSELSHCSVLTSLDDRPWAVPTTNPLIVSTVDNHVIANTHVVIANYAIQRASRDVQKINNVARFRQCSGMSLRNMASYDHVLGEHGVLTSIFWSDRSIRQITTYSVLLRHMWHLMIKKVKTHVVLLFHDITKQIFTVNLNQYLYIALQPSANLNWW